MRAGGEYNRRSLSANPKRSTVVFYGSKFFLLQNCATQQNAAKICDGLSHQEAHTITLARAQLGVTEIVCKGQPGLNSREAAEFRYLLSDGKNGADEDGRGFEL
jgi:type IV pilus biogenesis protein CpaD/CtpE